MRAYALYASASKDSHVEVVMDNRPHRDCNDKLNVVIVNVIQENICGYRYVVDEFVILKQTIERGDAIPVSIVSPF